MRATKGCKVCSGPEPRTVDRLLLLGRGFRFIAPIFGVTRADVKRHAERCLVGERRSAAERDLLRMACGAAGREGP